MRKFSRIILVFVLVLSFALTGCGKSDSEQNPSGVPVTQGATDTNNNNNDNKNDNNNSNTDENNSDNKDDFGKQDVKLGDLDSEDLPVVPQETTSVSMYYYAAQELSDTTFYPEPEELNGIPFCFNGTIMEELDSIIDYMDLNEHCKNMASFDTTTKTPRGYEVMTKWGKVIVVDIVPYQIKYFTDMVNNDNNRIVRIKSVLNLLMPYKKAPEKGETCKFYGFYLGYSEADSCPVFTFGVSNLSRYETFDVEYEKYVGEKTKHYKYRNHIEFDYPVGWSDECKQGNDIILFSLDNNSSFEIWDWDTEGETIKEFVDWYFDLDGYEDMPPEEEGGEPVYNPVSDIKLLAKESVTIGKNNDILAYRADIGYNYAGMGNLVEHYYIIEAKKSFVVIRFEDISTAKSDDTQTGENSENDEQTEDETETETKSLHQKEFENILKTITLCRT